MAKLVQLRLFDDDFSAVDPEDVKVVDGSWRSKNNPNNKQYESYDDWIKHFTDAPKTTDECWTPQDVYEKVVEYVGTIYDLSDKVIVRPFYPGGDYQAMEYPDNAVVIDNPPFSITKEILHFYARNRIPYFLFCNALTASFYDFTTLVFVDCSITFANGADVRCGFTTNLLPDYAAVASATLTHMIETCPSQNIKKNLPSWEYPEEVCRVSELQTIASGEDDFMIRRDECVRSSKLIDMEKNYGKQYFGQFLFLAKAKAKAKAKAGIIFKQKIKLYPSEIAIIDNLSKGKKQKKDNLI